MRIHEATARVTALAIVAVSVTVHAAPAEPAREVFDADRHGITVEGARLTLALAQPEESEADNARGEASEQSPQDHTGAPSSSTSAQELAKDLANPISDLISVPFQFNYDDGLGPKDASRYTLNTQPVIPFTLNEDWNLITRTIVPVIYQESLASGLDSDFGLGDTLQSFFFSPKQPVDGWLLGAGPVVLWPTGTEPRLRSESLSLGPTAIALRQEQGWTYGVLANHLWSLTTSDSHGEVNRTFVQPFVAYTWPTATTLSFNTETTYDWRSEDWTVPLTLTVSQVFQLGELPTSIQVGPRYYAESPENGPEWGFRVMVTFMFPK
jgi:hypothetical protein